MSYSELIVSDSPLGYWELNYWTPVNPNIMSSSSATYASQYGTVSSGVKAIVAGLGQSTALSTTTASIVIPNNTSILNVGNEKIAGSMELWFNLLTSSSNTTYIIKSQSSSTAYSLFQCYLINNKLWIESASGKDFINLLNLEDTQYINISYLNGNISLNLNNDESINITCDSVIASTQDQFIIGPGNGTASVHVNAFAIYKYILNENQINNRIFWAKRDGSPNSIAAVDGYSKFDINYLPATSFEVDILNQNYIDRTTNIIFQDDSLYLKKIAPVTISTVYGIASGNYTLSASGLRFDNASALPYVNIDKEISNFIFTNSTVKFQVNVSPTSSGTILSIGGFDNYNGIACRVIPSSSSPVLRLSLMDLYGSESTGVSSGSLSAGWHNIALNFNSSSISMIIDGVLYSSSITPYLINGTANSPILGSNPTYYLNSTNFVSNSDFSDGTTEWYIDTATSASIFNSVTVGYNSTTSLLAVNGSSGTFSVYYFKNQNNATPTTNMISVTAGNNYYVQANILSSSTIKTNANIRYYDSSLNLLASVSTGASVTASAVGWTTASLSAVSPASAAYAVPYFTASNVPASGSVYFDAVIMTTSSNTAYSNPYNNYIRNFGILPLTSSVTNYTSIDSFMLKFNNNLNVSQSGSAIGIIRDFNKTDKIIDSTISYGNPSSNIKVEHGKNSASTINWYDLQPNYPMVNYDFTNVTVDEIRITLSTDDSWYNIPKLDYFKIKYHTASAIYSFDGQFYITNENYSTSSLCFPIVNDINSDIFSKSSNLGLKVVSNITGGIKINPMSASIKKIDTLFKVDSFAKNTPLISDGTNIAYINTSGSFIVTNPSASVFLNGSSAVGGTALLGEIYHISVVYASYVPAVWLGYDSASKTAQTISFGNINVSSSSLTSFYGSDLTYSNKIYNNYLSVDTNIFANNILSEQVASMELYPDTSGSWGFTANNASATRSSASYVHGGYSILLKPSASLTNISCQTNSSGSVLSVIVPGRNYSGMVKIASSANRNARCNIIWYSSSLVTSSISVSYGASVSTSSSWSNFIITASAPMNANFAAVQAEIISASSTDNIYLDEFGLSSSNSSNWAIPNSNNLDVNDGFNQSASNTVQNYFSSDGYYFEMFSLPKIKIVTKQSTNTNI